MYRFVRTETSQEKLKLQLTLHNSDVCSDTGIMTNRITQSFVQCLLILCRMLYNSCWSWYCKCNPVMSVVKTLPRHGLLEH